MTHAADGAGGNRLAGEASLYLRQHAGNPVDWHPWGEEALAAARELDRPVFLSIGYASCHWCHVMEREIFTDADVAARLNEDFVCVKVDREERPDLDAVYMDAVQAMTGGGGWPLSVFLTPDLRPFFGGTYFPREQFLGLLDRIVRLYAEKRDELENSAAAVSGRLGVDPPSAAGDVPGMEAVSAAADAAMERFDERWGGFAGRQKFPVPPRWRLLLNLHRASPDERLAAALRLTLDRMADGGIRDQLGGGFHRYAVEPTWLVPHFEIMLYDNAQLASLYLAAAEEFDHAPYRGIGTGVLDFLLRDMAVPGGGFCASFDADSGGEEGSYYLWTPELIEKAAGPRDGPPLADLLGVRPGGNFEGRSIPTRRTPPVAVAERHGLDESEAAALFDRWRGPLLEKRGLRPAPELDRKIVTAWNGMAISALAAGYAAGGESRYLEAARGTADFLWAAHRRSDGRLLRATTAGTGDSAGVLDDYAQFACGLLDLYAAAGGVEHLERAVELIGLARDLFREPGGMWRLTPVGGEAPLGRRVDLYDSVEPSGAAGIIHAQLQAAALTGSSAPADEAAESVAAAAEMIGRAGLEMAWWLDAALLLARRGGRSSRGGA